MGNLFSNELALGQTAVDQKTALLGTSALAQEVVRGLGPLTADDALVVRTIICEKNTHDVLSRREALAGQRIGLQYEFCDRTLA